MVGNVSFGGCKLKSYFFLIVFSFFVFHVDQVVGKFIHVPIYLSLYFVYIFILVFKSKISICNIVFISTFFVLFIKSLLYKFSIFDVGYFMSLFGFLLLCNLDSVKINIKLELILLFGGYVVLIFFFLTFWVLMVLQMRLIYS